MTIVERLRATGILRRGSPARGFSWRHADGRPVSSADLERIEALKIPPAWTDVAVSPSPGGAVQAVGRDAAGRDQYRYHEAHVARRERRKEERLIRFVRALPRMRRRVAHDLARPGLDRRKVLAAVLTILSRCFFRPGSEQYADENGSYGLATLQRRHVSIEGSVVQFDFEGKSGKQQCCGLRHPRVARILRELRKVPGEVFKFRDDDGRWRDVKTAHINAYIKEVMGEAFSAKDFRTWAANLLSAAAFALAEPAGESEREARRRVAAVVRQVSGRLGNTPAVCRASYIFDAVIAGYREGRVIRRTMDSLEAIVEGRPAALQRTERALLALLRPSRGHRSGRGRGRGFVARPRRHGRPRGARNPAPTAPLARVRGTLPAGRHAHGRGGARAPAFHPRHSTHGLHHP